MVMTLFQSSSFLSSYLDKFTSDRSLWRASSPTFLCQALHSYECGKRLRTEKQQINNLHRRSSYTIFIRQFSTKCQANLISVSRQMKCISPTLASNAEADLQWTSGMYNTVPIINLLCRHGVYDTCNHLQERYEHLIWCPTHDCWVRPTLRYVYLWSTVSSIS